MRCSSKNATAVLQTVPLQFWLSFPSLARCGRCFPYSSVQQKFRHHILPKTSPQHPILAPPQSKLHPIPGDWEHIYPVIGWGFDWVPSFFPFYLGKQPQSLAPNHFNMVGNQSMHDFWEGANHTIYIIIPLHGLILQMIWWSVCSESLLLVLHLDASKSSTK